MKHRASLFVLSLAASLALVPLNAGAQESSPQDHSHMDGMMDHGMMGGGMKNENMMGGGDHSRGCDMMMGGEMSPDMSKMMEKMHEKLTHMGERVAALKTELKITEAQNADWEKFAAALNAAAKSAQASMDTMHDKMMKTKMHADLSESLATRVQMLSDHLARLQTIKSALDPLYASFNEQQKKIADGLKIGPMGVM